MENLAVPRLLISGAGSGVGKSMIMAGLAYEFRRRSMSVSCCVLGSHLSQAAILRRISGRFVRVLDERVLTEAQILVSLFQAGVGADLVLIEGRRGIFDGLEPGSFRGADAQFAALTRTPAVIVADSRGLGASIAALVKGCTDLAGSSRTVGGFDVAGAILNRTELGSGKGARNREFYERGMEAFEMPKLLGVLPEFHHDATFPQNDVSQQKNETLLPRQFLVDLGKLVGQHVDIDRIVEAAELAPAVQLSDYSNLPMGRRCRIAVSDDSCFSLVVNDNLDLLRYFGAELISFSPLADDKVPSRVGALYLTGACLHEYLNDLRQNSSMMQSIRDFSEKGGVIYAEGGGSAYLCRDFRCDGVDKPSEGVGLIPLSAVHDTAGFSYQDGVTLEESVIGRGGMTFRGLNTGEWRGTKEDRLVKAFRISRDGKPTFVEGYSPGPQILCTFSFLHFGSNPILAKNLADAAEVVAPVGQG